MAETTGREERFSLGEKLYSSRTVTLFGEINQDIAHQVSSQLLTLDAASADPIRLFINSQGGHIESGDTVHDLIRFINAPVTVIGSGWVASAAALIFVAVPRARRLCLPNTRFLLHQPLGQSSGRASELEIHAEQILRIRERINKMFAAATGQSLEKITNDTKRDFWMSASEAVDYGLAGAIIDRQSELEQADAPSA